LINPSLKGRNVGPERLYLEIKDYEKVDSRIPEKRWA
jgi:hypothetical protein